MSATAERLFSLTAWMHDGATPILAAIAFGCVLVALVAVECLPGIRKNKKLHRELRARCLTWLAVVLIVIPAVALGAVTTTLFVLTMSIAGYREFARSTGLFRDPTLTIIAGVGALALAAAAVDHWFAFFTAVTPCIVVLTVIAGLLRDQPSGYVQRVALGVLGFALVIVGPAYLSMLTIDDRARPLILSIMLAVALSDVAAFCFGKMIGGPKLAPRTSPNKTISGSIAGVFACAAVIAAFGSFIFKGSPMAGIVPLISLGLAVAAAAQLGDLVLSAIKRDIGIKDFGAILPGHGGVLDRIDSLLLVAPVAFYVIAYVDVVGANSEVRILTGGERIQEAIEPE